MPRRGRARQVGPANRTIQKVCFEVLPGHRLDEVRAAVSQLPAAISAKQSQLNSLPALPSLASASAEPNRVQLAPAALPVAGGAAELHRAHRPRAGRQH